MTEIATVRVQILGREFPVACPAGQEHELEVAAEFVDHRMREIQEKTGNSALERLAVMAALNIAHEHLTGETTEQNQELKRLADRIGTTLERLSEIEQADILLVTWVVRQLVMSLSRYSFSRDIQNMRCARPSSESLMCVCVSRLEPLGSRAKLTAATWVLYV